jgi:hypothetical protein
MAEADFARGVLDALAPHFHFHLEHPGIHHSGRTPRIDAIAVPRDPSRWSRPDIALGIEFKAPTERPGERRERKGNAKIISQCIDYSWTRWAGFGHIPIFFCPGFQEIRVAEQQREQRRDQLDWGDGYECGIGSLMAAVMGQNNIGELVHSTHLGWAFLLHGSHRIWSERIGRYPGGVGVGKHAKMLRKAGSR